MTPAARVQAAIEIVDEVLAAARGQGAAADTIVARYFKSRRYAGSKDRRAVRDLVYRAIRRHGEAPPNGRAALIGVAADDPALAPLFDGSPNGPAPIGVGERVPEAAVLPGWLAPRLDPLIGVEEQAALLGRAPLEVRVNSLRAERERVRADLPEAAPTSLSPFGLRLPEGLRIEDTAVWAAGAVEIQDEGSQLVALAAAPQPGALAVDLCAGAGGKTLALAALMQDRGRILACDTDRSRLSRMPQRLARAGVSIAESRLLDPGRETEALADLAGAADLVLVDAPCSGSGTWRRNPETRWRLTPERLARLTELQERLLDIAAGLVRPGGALVYAVCSLLAEEGRDQAGAFAARSSFIPESPAISGGRAAGTGRVLTPAHDGTDGFFVARWQRPC